jgi:hypothetical protein
MIKGKEMKISTIGFFKEGIKPFWEDDVNKNGGEF